MNKNNVKTSPDPSNAKTDSTSNQDWYDDGMTSAMELDDQGTPDTKDSQNGAPEYSSSTYDKLMGDAIAYGQVLSAEFKDDPRREVRKALDEAFALMAYQDPWMEMSVRHLLDEGGRAVVAEELNSAILGMFCPFPF